MTTLLVIAKEPIPGRSKTRLHPPLTLEEAAGVAGLCLESTLATANTLPVAERVLVWEGGEVPSLADGWRVVPQVDGDLDVRLAAGFEACSGPTVLIGMDTPQFTAGDLGGALAEDWAHDAYLGRADDGGFWAIGLAEPDGALLRDIPMSRPDTAEYQLGRLRGAGLSIGQLPTLTDVDTVDDLLAVAAGMPGGAFGAALRRIWSGAP